MLANMLGPAPLYTVDYDEIDRSIAGEPAYRADKPEYALLLFGPEARRHVWVVVDGEVVYLDRNGDGDLTAPDERFEKSDDCRNIEISEPDGKTRYVVKHLRVCQGNDTNSQQYVVAWVDIHGPLEYQQYCSAALGKTPHEAALAHFHGPLTIGPFTANGKIMPDAALTTGDKPGGLRAWVGTMSERHQCWVVVVSHTAKVCSFADGVRPKVTIEFPAREPDALPIVEHYSLDGFC